MDSDVFPCHKRLESDTLIVNDYCSVQGIVMSVRSVAMAVCQGEGKTLDLIENDVVWVASTFSWIAGQVAGVFMALISRATSLIYQVSGRYGMKCNNVRLLRTVSCHRDRFVKNEHFCMIFEMFQLF